MARVFPGRFTARIEGDFVVFMIGMRVNRFWKLHKWIPVARAMSPMLRTLVQNPEKGLLGLRAGWMGKGPVLVQYWRTFDDLDRFARNPTDPHLSAWRAFNHAIRASGDVGIWHETYKVRAGDYECVYGNMPRVGLAKAGEHLPAKSVGETASRRIGAATEDTPAIEPYSNP